MRSMLIIAAICLMATAAFGEIQSINKYPTHKANTASGFNRGDLDCSVIVELEWDVTQSATTVGRTNNVSLWPCDANAWDESGPESVVYHVTIDPSDPAWLFEFNPLDVDQDLVLFVDAAACDEADCYAVFDGGVYTSEPFAADIYIVIDGYGGNEGAFELTLTEYIPPVVDPLPSACLDFLQAFPGAPGAIVPDGTYVIAGDTCVDGLNHIAVSDCFGWASAGLDIYYEIVLAPGANLEIIAGFLNTGDAMLYLVDTCQNQDDGAVPTFLACADDTLAAGLEFINYTNVGTEDQIMYLVMDAYGEDACDTFEGIITLTGGAVATEDASWGSVKSMYR